MPLWNFRALKTNIDQIQTNKTKYWSYSSGIVEWFMPGWLVSDRTFVTLIRKKSYCSQYFLVFEGLSSPFFLKKYKYIPHANMKYIFVQYYIIIHAFPSHWHQSMQNKIKPSFFSKLYETAYLALLAASTKKAPCLFNWQHDKDLKRQ